MKNSNNKPTAAAAAVFHCSIIILAAAALLIMSSDAAKVFKVGDEFGWQQPSNNNSNLYPQWATSNRFQVGDSLLFEYQNDSVAEVDKWGYYHCNTTTSMAVFDNGRSTFKLEQPGPFYFISGNFNHCLNGQLLLVDVMSIHHHRHHSLPPAYSPGSYSNPPEGSYSMGPSSVSDDDRLQPSSGVMVSGIGSSVMVVVIATFVALGF
ncbi:Early nodulin-like protein 1 [Linum perenne]